MEDEAEIYDGIRAQFPVTFGKQSKSQISLEAIHNTTRRTNLPEKPSSSKPNDLPSLTSSSKAWLTSLRNSKSPNLNDAEPAMVGPSCPQVRGENLEEEEDNWDLIGPPRPPSGSVAGGEDEDGDVMVGPPRPTPGLNQSYEDGEMIGPPRPPAGSSLGDSDVEDGSDDEEENRYRIPMTNEIVLKGHTKVSFLFWLRMKLFRF